MIRAAILPIFIVLGGCVEYQTSLPPLVVNVTSEGQECRVSVATNPYQSPVTFTRVHQEQLLQTARGVKGHRGIVIYDRKAQYKCVGAAIITLQQAGLFADSVPWDN